MLKMICITKKLDVNQVNTEINGSVREYFEQI